MCILALSLQGDIAAGLYVDRPGSAPMQSKLTAFGVAANRYGYSDITRQQQFSFQRCQG